MNFWRYMQSLDEFREDAELADWLFGRMVQRATTFDDWRNIFYRAEFGSLDEESALLQTATVAKTFGQWLWIYEELSCRPSLNENFQLVKDTAIKQLVKLADNPTDANWTKNKEALSLRRWERIFLISSQSDGYDYTAFKKANALRDFAKDREIEKREKEMENFSPLKI